MGYALILILEGFNYGHKYFLLQEQNTLLLHFLLCSKRQVRSTNVAFTVILRNK